MIFANQPSSGPDASTPADRRPWYASLAEGLTLQLAEAERLDDLSAAQHAALAAGEVDAVPDLLDARQPVVERLSTLAQQCEPLAARLASSWSAVPEIDRENLSAAVARLGELIAAISARDAEDRVSLERHRNLVSEQIAGLDRGRGAVGAYLAEDATPHRAFQDREG